MQNAKRVDLLHLSCPLWSLVEGVDQRKEIVRLGAKRRDDGDRVRIHIISLGVSQHRLRGLSTDG